MEWQTEKLSGWISFRKLNGESIYWKEFEIPANEAVGKYAKYNILDAAGIWPRVKTRCVRHFMSYPIVSARLVPAEHLIFQWQDVSGLQCLIHLQPDFTPTTFVLEREEDSQLAINELRGKHLDTLHLDFYPSPGRIIDAAGGGTELRYLELRSSFDASTFSAIGRLPHLRGLQLDRLERWFSKKIIKNGKRSLEFTQDDVMPEMIFDSAAVAELRKLENFEVLALRNGITISDDALREIGTLKNLKALYLNLSNHEFADKSARVEALSFLKKLDKLEYLNISTRYPFSPDRLTVRDLELPSSLKYLELEGKVHRFRSVPVKPLVKLSAEDGALVCRFKEKEAFRVAGDGTTPESRRALVAALREMLLKMPPDDGAKIVEHGMVVTFDAPDLAKFIETELAIKVAPRA